MTPYRALLVYANEESLLELQGELLRLGVRADIASDASGALRMLQGARYDAVLLDDVLPGGGSLQVLEALERLGPDAPGTVMVGVPRGSLAAMQGEDLEGINYVTIPETPEESLGLAQHIRSRLGPAPAPGPAIDELLTSDMPTPVLGLPVGSTGAPVPPTRVVHRPRQRGFWAVLASGGILLLLVLLLLNLGRPGNREPGDGDVTGGVDSDGTSTALASPPTLAAGIATETGSPAATSGPGSETAPAAAATATTDLMTTVPVSTGAATGTAAPTSVPTLVLFVKVIGGVNVRAEPSREAPVRFSLPFRAQVIVEPELVTGPDDEAWRKVTHNGRTGYVLGTLLAKKRP